MSVDVEDLEMAHLAEQHVDEARLDFRDLTFRVPLSDTETLEILHGVSGFALPGTVTAIMGPSGSGKTTLLNILSGRIPQNSEINGDLLVNGKPLGKHYTKRTAGYVQQDDLLFSNMSVNECIHFAAELRLPRETSYDERIRRVTAVIDELGLRHVQNSLIGGELVKGISGGERKRASVALELVRDVSILLLDEPSSGLDSFLAYNLMKTLKELAQSRNMTIICTLHQPRSQIWNMFDYLLLLSQGKTMFFGEASKAVDFCRDAGYPCPEHFNPADHVLDIVAVDYRSSEKEKDSKERIEIIHAYYEKNKSTILGDVESFVGSHSPAIKSPSKDTEPNDQPTATFWTQFVAIFKRAFNQTRRSPFATYVRLAQTLFFAFLIGLIYLDVGTTQASVQDRSGVLFFVVINTAFGSMFQTINTFPKERPIFVRENESGFYGTSAYFLGKSFAEVPWGIPFPILLSLISYFMIGLQSDAAKFFIFVSALIWTGWAADGMGLMVGAIAPSVEAASAIAPAITIVFILVGGLYANPDSIPVYLIWVEAISYITYSYRILMRNEFKGLMFSCPPEDLITDLNNNTKCPIATGEEQLQFLSMDRSSLGHDFMYLILITLIMRLFAFVALKMSKPRKKRV